MKNRNPQKVLEKVLVFLANKITIKPNNRYFRDRLNENGDPVRESVPYADLDAIKHALGRVLPGYGLGVTLGWKYRHDDRNVRYVRGEVAIYTSAGDVLVKKGPWEPVTNMGDYSYDSESRGIARLQQRLLLLDVFINLDTEGEPEVVEALKPQAPQVKAPASQDVASDANQAMVDPNQATEWIAQVRAARKWTEFSNRVKALGVDDVMRAPADKADAIAQVVRSLVQPH